MDSETHVMMMYICCCFFYWGRLEVAMSELSSLWAVSSEHWPPAEWACPRFTWRVTQTSPWEEEGERRRKEGERRKERREEGREEEGETDDDHLWTTFIFLCCLFFHFLAFACSSVFCFFCGLTGIRLSRLEGLVLSVWQGLQHIPAGHPVTQSTASSAHEVVEFTDSVDCPVSPKPVSHVHPIMTHEASRTIRAHHHICSVFSHE